MIVRVLFIAFDNGEYAVRLASALAAEVELCLMAPATLTEPHRKWLSPAVDYRPFHKPRLRQPLQQLRTMWQLLRQINHLAPDVIYLQKAHLWFNLTLPLLRRYPLVISVHDPRDHSGDKSSKKTPQFIKDFGYRQADQVIIHSCAMKQVTVNELQIAPERIHAVPVMVAGDQEAALDEQEQPGQILFFGRIWAYKGLEYLIRAAPAIFAAVPEARIIIAGQGDDFAPYRALMADETRFIVHNRYISSAEQAQLFRRASVVVLPYTEATQSGVIPVAYNFAKPVVATQVGGLGEQVDDGVTGHLVPPRDETALAARVIELLCDPARRRQMGERGQEKLETEWSPQAIARQSVAVFERALAHRRRGPAPRKALQTEELLP